MSLPRFSQDWRTFGCGWFMLRLNHQRSYETFCITPACSLPSRSTRNAWTGHLRNYKNESLESDLKRLISISRGRNTSYVDQPREKPIAFTQQGATEFTQSNRTEPSPGGASNHGHHYQQEGLKQKQAEARHTNLEHSQTSKKGAITALSSSASTLGKPQKSQSVPEPSTKPRKYCIAQDVRPR